MGENCKLNIAKAVWNLTLRVCLFVSSLC